MRDDRNYSEITAIVQRLQYNFITRRLGEPIGNENKFKIKNRISLRYGCARHERGRVRTDGLLISVRRDLLKLEIRNVE